FGIDRYLNIRSANGPTFSPDGRFVAFLTNITGVSQVWQVPASGGWPVQLTFSSESVRDVHYNPRKYELIFSMDTGGNERTQPPPLAGVAPTDYSLGGGWTSQDMSGLPAAIPSFGGFAADGEQFAFSANREEGSRFDIYVQKFGDPNPRLVQKG